MTYTPVFRPQIGDPTTGLDGWLCSMESGAMGLDFHTGGRIREWGGQLVPYCGKTVEKIKEDGTNLVDVARAWAHWGQTFNNRTGDTWLAAEMDLDSGHLVMLQGDYDRFTLAERCQDSFLGGHMIVVLPQRSGTKRLTGDPLCNTFRWIESSSLRSFAEKLGQKLGTNEARQPIYFGSVAPKVAVQQTGADMAIRYMSRAQTQRVMHLPLGTPLYDRAGGKQVTKMHVAADVPYLGYGGIVGGKKWRAVQVVTGWSYPDPAMYPTGLYVLDGAGTVRAA